MRQQHAVIASLLLLAVAASGCGGSIPAATADDAKRSEDLAAELKDLKELVPDQAHIMADVGYHFSNLWFAGKAENWPLAEFYLNESKSHLRWAVRVKPIRKDASGRDINLPGILEAFENSQLAQLKGALDRKDGAAFAAAYRDSLTSCYACHKASDKPYLRPQIPSQPEASIINFDPKANWPR